MKSTTVSPTHAVETEIKNRETLLSEVPVLEARVSATAARITELSVAGSVDDVAVLDEFNRLQALSVILPIRLDDRRRKCAAADDALIEACHQFITSYLGPRIRELGAAASAAARKRLASEIPDPASLDFAVSRSLQVMECQRIDSVASVGGRPEHPGRFAENLLAVSRQVDELACKLQKQ
jgi:hypothetical protein